MVEPKSHKIFYFFAFIIPCLVLYLIFFIWPFLHGFYISLTNWDGLTPKTPITIHQEEFETQILDKITKQSDKTYILSMYQLNQDDKTYSRIGLSSGERKKVEKILSSVKYEPANNRFVGFNNYIKILTGNVKESFYPRRYSQTNYNSSSNLPVFIDKKSFEEDIIKKASEQDKQEFLNHYQYDGEQYKLNQNFNKLNLEDFLYNLPEVDTDKTVSDSVIGNFISSIEKTSLIQDENAKNSTLLELLNNHMFSDSSISIIQNTTNELYELGAFRILLGKTWISNKFDMGVVGFTAFFALFSVIGINFFAFFLALVLDTKIKGQKVLRSIFFLPNVLSMIIVALIWSMLFYQLLPAITGIQKWISDPVKTPWLLVIVAVWQGCGYYMIVYLAGLQNIPTDVIEASTIDGASTFQRFRFITLPLLLPAITISLFLTIANALKSFDLVYAMIGPTGYALGTVPFVMDIYFDAFAQKQAGMANAKAMVLFVVIFAITGLQLFLMKRKEIEQ